MKRLGYVWFTGNSIIGIVLVKTPVDAYYAFIENGQGHNEEDDISTVINRGNYFPVKQAIGLIDCCGTVVDTEAFIGLAKEMKVELTQYQNQSKNLGAGD